MSEELSMVSVALEGRDYGRFLDNDRRDGHRQQLALKAGTILTQSEADIPRDSKKEKPTPEQVERAFWEAWDRRYKAIRHKIGHGAVQTAQA